MYLLFRYHNIKPSAYYNMGYGERAVMRAFVRYEMEEKIKELKMIQSTGVGG